MALKKFYGTQEEIPEALRNLYIQKDGKFVLDIEGGVEDVTGLKSALGKERARADKAEKDLKSWAESGVEAPDKVRELLAQLDTLSKLDPKSEAEKLAQAKIESIKTQLTDSHSKEKKILQDKNVSITSQLKEVLVDKEVQRVLSLPDVKGNATLLLPHIRSKVQMVENSQGTYVAQVLDDAGNPRVNSDARDMSITDLVNEFRQDPVFASAFEGTGSSGSGPQNNAGDNFTPGTVDNPTVLRSNDPFVLGEHAEAIADGSVIVEPPE